MIAEMLLQGERNAIPMSHLADITGMPVRKLKAEVLRERLHGELILSSDKGYYLPDSDEEIMMYTRKRKAYLRTARKALRPFTEAIRKE